VSQGTDQLTGLRNERKPCHFWVDNEVADCYQPIVGADAIWVYCRIARNAHGAWIVSPKVRGGDTRISLREMAEWCGKSVDTVSRCLQVLEHVGLLQAVRGAKAKGRYALADVKDLVTREGGLYDRETGSFQLPAKRTVELKLQVRELRAKLARKSGSRLAIVGRDEASSSVAQSDRLGRDLFAVANAGSDTSVAPGVHASITTKSKKAKQTTSPLPPQAGADEFSPEQLAHLGTLSGEPRGEFERYYREQNCQKAEAAEEERAKAKRLEELKRILPDEPSAVPWAMAECGFAMDERRRGVRGAICAVLGQECARGRPAWDAAPAMVKAWRDYNAIFDLLEVPYGPVKFFRLGVWARRNSWRIDEKKSAAQHRASVGRPA